MTQQCYIRDGHDFSKLLSLNHFFDSFVFPFYVLMGGCFPTARLKAQSHSRRKTTCHEGSDAWKGAPSLARIEPMRSFET